MLTKEDWKDIIYKNGKINEEQVFKELNDYSFLMEQASKVYEHIAGLSKVNYYAKTIISEYEERVYDKEITREDIGNIIKENKELKDLVDELKDYFQIED